MATIEIGSPAINRDSNTSTGGYTNVLKDKVATGTGKISTIKIWSYTALTGLKVGTFYLTSPSTVKCRSASTIGDVVAGAVQTFQVDLDVVAGDMLGFFVTGGAMEYTTSGDGT